MVRSCARRSFAAETIFMALVICCVFLTERMRRRISIKLGMCFSNQVSGRVKPLAEKLRNNCWDRSVDRRKRLSHVRRAGLAPLWGRRFRLSTHFFSPSDARGSDRSPRPSPGGDHAVRATAAFRRPCSSLPFGTFALTAFHHSTWRTRAGTVARLHTSHHADDPE